jgi:hypothetical protein
VQSRGVLTRRALLGLAGLSVVACDKHPKRAVRALVVVPDAAALVTARNLELVLLASYDAKIAQVSARRRPALEVAKAIHVAHLDALHGSTSSTSSTSDIAVVANLRHELRVSAATLRDLSRNAVNGTNAAVFASIAASHQTSAQ